MQIYWTPILKIVNEAPDTYTFQLELPDGFTWDEGAHTHFALEGFNKEDRPNRSLIRHMSISTLPREGAIGITTRIKRECSEFKSILRDMKIGEQVAIFKTHSNVPLQRDGKNVYLLSAGVGLATFRPIVLEYLQNGAGIPHLHSLNVDTSANYLFNDVFTSSNSFTAEFVANRSDYYAAVEMLATDQDGLYYIVGSDDFLRETIATLRERGIARDQIMLDKHDFQLDEFLAERDKNTISSSGKG
ncbi:MULTISPECIES: FAD-dependent oxidoreductase [unclassified Exiguobacterium]|uniref:FAD-dependent oxidoreductase n=1 Tax=unclassified Exiguobacterium TaxID=2644629 RepID=UPI00103D9BC0|nr:MULTISPECIES: FAD-dependent oxidoreductase [unclassified Exiguobacterium]TCI27134.1 FAD-dependent oxidoreductase [Exiguobacterium sp. SH5S4]TCI64009.1 FAD-dependent oxidoreductase [Exiguobacterium sp. SH3S1]